MFYSTTAVFTIVSDNRNVFLPMFYKITAIVLH